MFLLGLGFRPGIFLASAGELSQERAIATDVSAGEAQHLEAFSRRVTTEASPAIGLGRRYF